ncbi:hypothetical protein DAI22_03g282050 [Oryza sativa Japonica Group]|nr:hypothetical protein DAI22_03g282050 [Oryza sativa Japonica Group]
MREGQTRQGYRAREPRSWDKSGPLMRRRRREVEACSPKLPRISSSHSQSQSAPRNSHFIQIFARCTPLIPALAHRSPSPRAVASVVVFCPVVSLSLETIVSFCCFFGLARELTPPKVKSRSSPPTSSSDPAAAEACDHTTVPLHHLTDTWAPHATHHTSSQSSIESAAIPSAQKRREREYSSQKRRRLFRRRRHPRDVGCPVTASHHHTSPPPTFLFLSHPRIVDHGGSRAAEE